MRIVINVPEAQAAALAAKARALGLTPEEYAARVLEQDFAPEWLHKAWTQARAGGRDQLSSAEIDAEIAAARKARSESRRQPGS